MGVIQRLSAIDRYTLAYVVVTLPGFFFLGGDDPARWMFLAARLAIVAAIVIVRNSGAARSRFGSWALDLYPLPLFGYFYAEVAILNRVFFPDRFLDDWIVRIEQDLFGGQPAMDFRERAPWAPLAEYLHLAYVSYYTYLPLLVTALLAAGRRVEMRAAVGTVGLTYYVGFLLFILIPVAGPYYVFEHLDPEQFGYVMPTVAQWFIDRGSSIGTAFPSSHVSIGVTVWIMAMRYHRGLAWGLAGFVPAMAAGAVYGGFHYLIDILAGAALGLAIGVWGHRLTVAQRLPEDTTTNSAKASGATVSGA